tara:strand:+ start:21019 stop:22023 length:1005 start_codon:yes stop_codon:yes gene_type:complete
MCKVIDRTGLILEIFGARARTKEGILQVELAALQYQKSRLVRSWTHLERQRGGRGFLGGPGERQIESDRRQLSKKINRIEKSLKKITMTRSLQQQSRNKVPFPIVAIVGYTNAGKSCLFNQLTSSKVISKDMLFATLDPTMRLKNLENSIKIIFSDTVGFISDIPHQLVAAFSATLEEVKNAELILHVHDASSSEKQSQNIDVKSILKQIGVSESTTVFEVNNKIDLIKDNNVNNIKFNKNNNKVFWLSALSGEGCEELLKSISEFFSSTRIIKKYRILSDQGNIIASLYGRGKVIERTEFGTETLIKVAIDPIESSKFEKLFISQGEGAIRID